MGFPFLWSYHVTCTSCTFTAMLWHYVKSLQSTLTSCHSHTPYFNLLSTHPWHSASKQNILSCSIHQILLLYHVRVLFPIHSPLLIKTPQALLKEVSSYEASIQSVERKAQELVDSDHFAAEDISQQMASLQRQWRELKLVSGRRTQKLSDALEAQKVRHYSVYLNHNLLSCPGSSW